MKGGRRGGKRIGSVGIGVEIGGLGMWCWRCSGVCLLGWLLLCWGSRSQNYGPHIILPVIAIQISQTLLHGEGSWDRYEEPYLSFLESIGEFGVIHRRVKTSS